MASAEDDLFARYEYRYYDVELVVGQCPDINQVVLKWENCAFHHFEHAL